MNDSRMIWYRLGNRIAEMRTARGITQFELAEKTGLSRVYIGYIEQGKRCATILTYLDIVTVLGYSLNDLVRDNIQDTVPELVAELSEALTACSTDERESILRTFREMMNMIRMLHRG